MQKRNFWEFETEIDENATKAWYAQSEEWGCECGHCRNFLTLARKRELPKPVLDTLDSLGLPPEKATYVCQLYAEGDKQYYQFSYRIAGNICGEGGVKPVPKSWGMGLCCHETYPYGAPGFPEPHFDLEFWLFLPWVPEESPNG